jgi:hypothetical protein
MTDKMEKRSSLDTFLAVWRRLRQIWSTLLNYIGM